MAECSEASAALCNFVTENQARTHWVSRGETLFSVHEPIDQVYWLEQGRFRCLRRQSDGSEAIILHADTGPALIHDALIHDHYPYEAVAMESSCVYALNKDDLEKAIATDANLARALYQCCLQQQRLTIARLECLQINRAADRLLQFCYQSADPDCTVALPCAQKHWAAVLGLEPETLYRQLRALKEQGVLAQQGRRLQLLDCPAERCGG